MSGFGAACAGVAMANETTVTSRTRMLIAKRR
jgi:hypothetical protein